MFIDSTKINRVEVIDHRRISQDIGMNGRVLVEHPKAVELSVQDNGRTLKIFLVDPAEEKT